MAYMATHEIATHTVHHAAPFTEAEIVGARTWLNQARALAGVGGSEGLGHSMHRPVSSAAQSHITAAGRLPCLLA